MRDLPLFYAPDIASSTVLPESEAGHLLRVLRGSVGDELLITDGRGMLYEAVVKEIGKRQCSVEILSQTEWTKPWRERITLAIAPTKAIERMEWLLEKAVEIGVDRVILLKAKHSERKHINAERLERIMLSAMKQSQKAILPTLAVDMPIAEALRSCAAEAMMIAHCRVEGDGIAERIIPSKCYTYGEPVSLFIGPEGDFTEEEITFAQSLGAHGITLGESRLRTETAAVVALQWIHTLGLIHQHQ